MTAARNAVPYVPHCIARAKERYGLDLGPADLGRIAGMIQRNECKLDRQNPDGKTQWFLTYKGTPIRVVIDKSFYKVITFLPLVDDPAPPKRQKRKKIYRRGKAAFWEARS